MQRFREIVESREFCEQLSLLERDEKRADDFLDGLKWLLSKDPTQGIRLSGNFWMFHSSKFSSVPFVVYYSFDLTKVYLLWIEIDTPEI